MRINNITQNPISNNINNKEKTPQQIQMMYPDYEELKKDLIETNTRIYPVGRLDYDTTGALILTNDGNLANLLMRPDSQVDKTYIAKVKGIVQIPDIQKLRNGIIIDGVKTKKDHGSNFYFIIPKKNN